MQATLLHELPVNDENQFGHGTITFLCWSVDWTRSGLVWFGWYEAVMQPAISALQRRGAAAPPPLPAPIPPATRPSWPSSSPTLDWSPARRTRSRWRKNQAAITRTFFNEARSQLLTEYYRNQKLPNKLKVTKPIPKSTKVPPNLYLLREHRHCKFKRRQCLPCVPSKIAQIQGCHKMQPCRLGQARLGRLAPLLPSLVRLTFRRGNDCQGKPARLGDH